MSGVNGLGDRDEDVVDVDDASRILVYPTQLLSDERGSDVSRISNATCSSIFNGVIKFHFRGT